MKAKYIFIIPAVFFICCDEGSKKSADAQKDRVIEAPKVSDIKKNIQDTIVEKGMIQDTLLEANAGDESEFIKRLDFEKYPSDEFVISQKAALDFSGNEKAAYFKTRITNAYKSDQADFASYYITVTFGCGASCINGFMMDIRDGKIYNLPLGEEHSCLFAEERAIFKPNSRLFVSGICKQNPEDEKLYYDALLWNETKKIFEKTEEKEIIKTNAAQ